MQLQDFFDYKNQLMQDILTNEKIVHLIDEDINMEDAKSLAYRNVYPYEYVPDTNEKSTSYICFDVDVTQSYDSLYLRPALYIYVFTHRSLLRCEGGGVRTDALCNEICNAINGSRKYGLGELNIYSVKRFAPMTDYQGKCMLFYATEFNHVYNGNQEIPSNRKRG